MVNLQHFVQGCITNKRSSVVVKNDEVSLIQSNDKIFCGHMTVLKRTSSSIKVIITKSVEVKNEGLPATKSYYCLITTSHLKRNADNDSGFHSTRL